MISNQDIYDKIALSNNGKLMICRFNAEEKLVVNKMLKENLLCPARFMNYGDAVRVV